ncbi:uncharacterized protein LOC132182222 [Corylus avellana]|uniref:uncharacterized protein LOC132182222 n=1 Tax=Corylus avellana TaxID=13451 RepID=UPI00286C2D9C|nr:uncharacterized protein LOC132182222 [Corylus avellana]
MVNMPLSYQWCMVPMTGGSLCRVATLGSYTKKTNLCFSTPLLLKRKMPSINRSPPSLFASPSKANSHPLMMIPPDEEEDGRSLCRFYDYVNENVINTNIKIPEEVNHAICIGSSHGWLAYISRLDCSVFLWSPFTTSPLISLPPIHTLPSITVIPREDVDEDEILKRYEGDALCHKWKSAYESDDDSSPDFGFKVEWDYPDQSQSFYTRSANRLILYLIRKIVLSSVPTSDDCIVVAVPGLSIHRSIAFCKPGDKSWTFVEPPLKKNFDIVDVIHFNDQLFYAITSCGVTLYAYDLADLSSPKSYLIKTCFAHKHLSSLEKYTRISCGERYYLVESSGELLWVCRFFSNEMNSDGEIIVNSDIIESPDQTTMFDVYRLDFCRNRWEPIRCIGDQVLFVGTNQSLCLSAQSFPNLKANCIYFTDDSCEIHKKYPLFGCEGYVGNDYGHYELSGGYVFGELCRFGDGRILPPPFWVMRHFH